MSQKRYVVELSEEERARLHAIVQSSQRIARKKRMRAQVLLKVDAGKEGVAWSDERAAEAFDVHVNTVHTIRKQVVLDGFDRALERQKPDEPSRKPVFTPKQEAGVLAVATGRAPEGYARWTLRLLASEVVRLEIVDSVCHETVQKALKKGTSSPTVK